MIHFISMFNCSCNHSLVTGFTMGPNLVMIYMLHNSDRTLEEAGNQKQVSLKFI